MVDRTPVCLTIATSDSGGGAGIQADLKAFAAQGVHGTSAIVGLTAQSTVAVTRIEQVSPAMIVEQVRVVVEDLGVDAVKIGMVGTQASIAAVVEALGLLPAGTPVVLDPVMVAESGARLLEPAAHRDLVEGLLPRTTVVTPNLPEALALAGLADDPERADDDARVEEVARAIAALGPSAVLITGGHRGVAADTLLLPDGSVRRFAGERHPDGAAHGSGCTHSSTLAARLALGDGLERAARVARAVAGEAVRRGLRDVGAGAGPVDALDLPALRALAAGVADAVAPVPDALATP
ncbi:bifunctional hydroxymethylpyrimidine kinase/phosphomethylpyrimidine kinase [Patulibacter sp. SYSU D01012]|uniref:bifunctional hydroxymethylpyrimidine kinase/phosphomethylpyrimidine kinase n=1 Tax=Patulibacter sp. SYSU D01012 TaxID=2817381 RepID=UPI001B30D995|nr:bifunctional hydroxymethylpyrimidine kinase/phosphomethylpyrimidine kinase [Patulibacter sp. SYSU D01012]